MCLSAGEGEMGTWPFSLACLLLFRYGHASPVPSYCGHRSVIKIILVPDGQADGRRWVEGSRE